MFEIITTIIFIIFVSISLTTFFTMRKTIKIYREESMHLRRRLYEEEENLQQYVCDKPDFKTYCASIEVPNSKDEKWKSKIDLVTKKQLAIELAERIIKDNNIFLDFEEDKLNNNVKITASIRVATVNNDKKGRK